MGTRAKRQKLNEEVPTEKFTSDPIAYLREPLIHDLILQHLSFFEVKTFFRVSKSWNEEATVSSKAMSNIKLVVNMDKLSLKDVTLLLNSRRKYKSATISVHLRSNIDRKTKLLEKLCLTLEEFDYSSSFRRMVQRDTNLLNAIISFPKLKKLALRDIDSPEIRNNIIAKTTEQLEELEFECNNLFHTPMPPIKGKLISFKYFESKYGRQYNQQSHDSEFLTRISATVQTLEVPRFDQFQIILTKMPALKVFGVRSLDCGRFATEFVNQTITNLKLGTASSCISENIFKSMENLATIELQSTDKSFLSAVLKRAKEAKRLKEIKIGFSFYCSPFKVYNKMVESNSSIPRRIEIVHKCLKAYCCGTF